MFTWKLLQGAFGLAAGAVVAGGIGFSGAAHAAPVYDTAVGAGNYIGSRTIATLDILPLAPDPDRPTAVTVAWDIGYSMGTGLWSYNYSVSWLPTTAQAISHMTLDLSDNCTSAASNCVIGAKLNGNSISSGNTKYGTYTSSDGNSNPGMGGPITGVKFDVGSGTPYDISFTSERAPVWGDFYTKSGNLDTKGWIAQNIGIDDHNSSNILHFVARPDTVGGPPDDGPGPGIDVPEPMSMAVLGVGLLGLAAARRRRNALS